MMSEDNFRMIHDFFMDVKNGMEDQSRGISEYTFGSYNPNIIEDFHEECLVKPGHAVLVEKDEEEDDEDDDDYDDDDDDYDDDEPVYRFKFA